MNENRYSDYRYYLNDLYRYYFGVRSTYAELLDEEDIPPRFKAVIRHYLLNCVQPETTLESHLYHLRPGDPEFPVFKGLDARIRLTLPEEHRTITGRKELLYKESIMTAEELAAVSPEEKSRRGFRLCELQIPRRKLREFSL